MYVFAIFLDFGFDGGGKELLCILTDKTKAESVCDNIKTSIHYKAIMEQWVLDDFISAYQKNQRYFKAN